MTDPKTSADSVSEVRCPKCGKKPEPTSSQDERSGDDLCWCSDEEDAILAGNAHRPSEAKSAPDDQCPCTCGHARADHGHADHGQGCFAKVGAARDRFCPCREYERKRSNEATDLFRVEQPDGYIVTEGSWDFCNGFMKALVDHTDSSAYMIVQGDERRVLVDGMRTDKAKIECGQGACAAGACDVHRVDYPLPKLWHVVRDRSNRYLGAYEWVRNEKSAMHFITREAADEAAEVARRDNGSVEVIETCLRTDSPLPACSHCGEVGCTDLHPKVEPLDEDERHG